MHGWPSDWTPFKEFVTSFSSLTLHGVNLLLWMKDTLTRSFQNYCKVKTNNLLRVFLMVFRISPFFSFWWEGEGGGGGGVSPCKVKSLNLPLLSNITLTKNWIHCTSSDHRPTDHNSCLIAAIRQILPNILCVVFELRNHDLFEKSRWN